MAKKNPSKASKDWKEKRQKKEGPERSLAEEGEVKEIKNSEKEKDKKEKKVYDLPGQKHDTPDERDPLRIFFEMLYRQLPDNELAASWMMEWGLLPPEAAKMVYEKLQKSPQKKLESPDKAAALEKASTCSVKKNRKMTSETVLKAKKRKRIGSNSDGGHDDSISRKKKNKKLKVSI
ncbi:muscle M-line assembly protein unc-89-like [Phoenix dactylifera]|uniref:Muscle M-line assembly protein unc-89-like n=1 Tax=Phoenix dactylifera TaxID=42345 RepID=A0A8B7BHB7_PHODC|nr:muscle M-line assembly protein unc-89-like [Phoenix dactylifera]